MKYTVEISAQARKQLKKMPKSDKKKILDKIDSLADDPRPSGYKKLSYYTEYFRIRVWKLPDNLYNSGQRLLVVIFDVIDRRDAY